ncbi:hypothetical protein EYF80_006545 [Liparis tanakae]|uniref:Uncharacterized protein n=1 Tax=Liparis tanakae TaxID=230148 RepID=A0A4Z2J103_9TELE|nr:hypothetical protein EYF80_006545 [Liparis tanakae]
MPDGSSCSLSPVDIPVVWVEERERGVVVGVQSAQVVGSIHQGAMLSAPPETLSSSISRSHTAEHKSMKNTSSSQLEKRKVIFTPFPMRLTAYITASLPRPLSRPLLVAVPSTP